jgi:hypothetical protein
MIIALITKIAVQPLGAHHRINKWSFMAYQSFIHPDRPIDNVETGPITI